MGSRPARVWRGGTGQALLLIHGEFGDAHQHWHWVWEQLGDTFTVAAPDLPGFGETPELPSASFPALAGWVAALMETLGFPRASIVGNSIGAAVARLYAQSQPYRVTHLVLANGGVIHRIPGPARRLMAAPFIGAPIFEWLRRRTFSRNGLRRCVADARFLTPEFVDGALRHSNGYATAMREAALVQMDSPPAKSTASATVSTPPWPNPPTLILWGEADRQTPRDAGQRLASQLPGAKYRPIPRAGRLPQMERPAEFVRAVREFCRGR